MLATDGAMESADVSVAMRSLSTLRVKGLSKKEPIALHGYDTFVTTLTTA
jgi:hypothetical protein